MLERSTYPSLNSFLLFSILKLIIGFVSKKPATMPCTSWKHSAVCNWYLTTFYLWRHVCSSNSFLFSRFSSWVFVISFLRTMKNRHLLFGLCFFFLSHVCVKDLPDYIIVFFVPLSLLVLWLNFDCQLLSHHIGACECNCSIALSSSWKSLDFSVVNEHVACFTWNTAIQLLIALLCWQFVFVWRFARFMRSFKVWQL